MQTSLETAVTYHSYLEELPVLPIKQAKKARNTLQIGTRASRKNLPDNKQDKVPQVRACSFLGHTRGSAAYGQKPGSHLCQSHPVKVAQINQLPLTLQCSIKPNQNSSQTAAELSYRGNLRVFHTLFPDYIYGCSLTSFCQADGNQLAHATAKAYLDMGHLDIGQGVMTQADPREQRKQHRPRASPLSCQLRQS